MSKTRGEVRRIDKVLRGVSTNAFGAKILRQIDRFELGMPLDASARPILGTTIQWLTTGIPAGTAFGALLRSAQQAVPAVDLTAVGMTGCAAHVVNPVATVFVSPGSAVQQPEVIRRLKAHGVATLPVTVVDGVVVKEKVYPSYDELKQWIEEGNARSI